MKTYSQKKSEVARRWVLVDASSAPLGRLATTIAKYLIGKYKPTYTAHIDSGDYVVVVNAAQLVVTGKKLDAKVYYRHSGYPGGLKERTLKEQLQVDPAFVIREAVRGMLPKNKLSDDRLGRLKIYAGEEHAHAPQSPEKVEVEK